MVRGVRGLKSLPNGTPVILEIKGKSTFAHTKRVLARWGSGLSFS